MTKHPPQDADRLLDEALASIRNDEPDADEMRAAAGRVREALREGKAPAARRPRAGGARPARTSRAARWRPLLGVAAALVVVVGAALVAGLWPGQPPAAGSLGRFEQIDGALFRVSEAGLVPVRLSDPVRAGTTYRTAVGAGAQVRLDDGSLVELDERSVFSVKRRGDDTTIDLPRGEAIVEASDQGAGHLRVSAQDCDVSVTGTVFAVNSGMKGSRVSVLEGEVEVSERGDRRVVVPGQQIVTSDAIAPVALEDEIAWSARIDRHLALLAELKDLGREIEQALEQPGLRRDTRLLDLVPEDTVVYAAFPNLGEEISEAREVIRSRVAQSPVLGAWWNEHVAASGGDEILDAITDKARQLGDALGEEIVIAVPWRRDASAGVPLLIASVVDDRALDTLITDAPRVFGDDAERKVSVTLHEGDPLRGDLARPGIHVWHGDGVVVVTGPGQRLPRAVRTIVDGGRFPDTEFGRTLSDEYADGIEWLLGVDVASITAGLESAGKLDGQRRRMLDFIGITEAQHLVVEHERRDGRSRHAMELEFGGERRGVMSWLAEPAPLGSLDFVSPNAISFLSAALKDPRAMIEEDLFRVLPDSALAILRDTESKVGVRLADDLAASIGGDFTFAIDGPIFPIPSWKLAVEVYDPARLHSSIEAIVAAAEDAAAEHGLSPPTLQTERYGGRVFHVVRGGRLPVSIAYTFVDGYFLAGSTPTLLRRAIENRAAGYSIASSPELRDALPRDRETNVSALMMQDFSHSLGGIARALIEAGGLSEEQRRAAEDLVSDGGRAVSWAYARDDRIEFAGRSKGSVLTLTSGAWFDVTGLTSLGRMAEQGRPDDGTGDGR